MDRTNVERRLLQIAVAVAAIVPVAAGTWGALGGLHAPQGAADSQARYLSGLLLAIGLGFWATIPRIETRGAIFRTLAAVVVVGGLARLAGAIETGLGAAVSLPLLMELGVTPLLALWRERVAHRRAGGRPARSKANRSAKL